MSNVIKLRPECDRDFFTSQEAYEEYLKMEQDLKEVPAQTPITWQDIKEFLFGA